MTGLLSWLLLENFGFWGSIVNPQRDDATLVVVACAEDFDHIGQAERAFQALGRALGESIVLA